MAEDKSVEYQQILREWMKPTFERLSITEVIETRPNALVLCLPLTHRRNKRKHPLQFLFQMKEKKLSPLDRQVCIHNNWWTEVIWNKDEECYYTNGLLKRLHDYDKTNSEESEEDQNNEEVEGPTVDQKIRQTPIDPMLHTSPLLMTTSTLPDDTTTMSTQTINHNHEHICLWASTNATTKNHHRNVKSTTKREKHRTAKWQRTIRQWRTARQWRATRRWGTRTTWGRRTTPSSSTTHTGIGRHEGNRKSSPNLQWR